MSAAAGGLMSGLAGGLMAGEELNQRKKANALLDQQVAARGAMGSELNDWMDANQQQNRALGLRLDRLEQGGGMSGRGVRPRTSLPEAQYLDTTDDARASRGASRVEGDRDPNPAGITSARQPTFVSLIDQHEGGGDYDTLFGHAQRGNTPFAGIRPSQMTIGELKQFTDPSGEYGQWVKQRLAESGQRARVATPMGRFQIVGTTLRNAAREMGLSDDTVFDQRTQTQIATHLARRRLASAKTPAGKRRAMRAEWEGFKHVSDADLDRAIRELENA